MKCVARPNLIRLVEAGLSAVLPNALRVANSPADPAS
jgi:hypothetical protein